MYGGHVANFSKRRVRDNSPLTTNILTPCFDKVRYASLHSTLHLLLFLSGYRSGRSHIESDRPLLGGQISGFFMRVTGRGKSLSKNPGIFAWCDRFWAMPTEPDPRVLSESNGSNQKIV